MCEHAILSGDPTEFAALSPHAHSETQLVIMYYCIYTDGTAPMLETISDLCSLPKRDRKRSGDGPYKASLVGPLLSSSRSALKEQNTNEFPLTARKRFRRMPQHPLVIDAPKL